MDFVALENAGKKIFEQFPVIKRSCKRVYQLSMYALSKDKFKVDGEVRKVSPNDKYEYFYGYYDKSPWDKNDRYMLCIRVKQAYKSVAPKEKGEIVIIDTKENNKVIKIADTKSWNVQQGCMVQWLGPDFSEKIIYNDFRNGEYCSVIFNVKLNIEEKVINKPIYDVSRDGKFALSLDFSRLHRLRKGYGYSNLPDTTENDLCPNETCIWKINLDTNEVVDLLKYTDFSNFEANETMIGAEHKVNHIMISPNGKRFMVLHRWFQRGRKNTRLVTVNCDGSDMYNLSDDVFVSHCYWKNDEEILSFLRKKETGDHYYLMKDRTQEYKMLWPELNTDGHCSYSPNGNLIITDTYPNRKRLAYAFVCKENGEVKKIASVFAPFRYDNDVRCDLHPRWNREGNKVCIDSVHNGKRALYVIDLSQQIDDLEIDKRNSDSLRYTKNSPIISFIIPAYNAGKTIGRTIKSITNQEGTSVDYEVIVVDDGSDDDLREKVKEFKSDERLKYFYKENTGESDTRNYGVNQAMGEYIIFVDSDDYISKTLLRDIEQYINQKIDLIKWRPVFVDEDGNVLRKEESNSFNKVSGEKGFNLLFGKDNLIDCLWNYAIKKELVLEFPKGMYHEDFATMPLMILKAKTMVSINKYEYYYVQSQNSIMRNQNEEMERKKLQDKLVHFDNLLKQSKKMPLKKMTKENLAIFATNSLLAVIPDLDEENKIWFEKELKSRKIAKNIKIRSFKQFIKRIMLEVKY